MWSETGIDSFHIDRIFGRVHQVYITLDSDGTNLTLNAAQSSPNTTGSGVAAGVNITYEAGGTVFWSGIQMSGTQALTSQRISTATPGSATFVINAAPSAGGKLFITFHVSRTG